MSAAFKHLTVPAVVHEKYREVGRIKGWKNTVVAQRSLDCLIASDPELASVPPVLAPTNPTSPPEAPAAG